MRGAAVDGRVERLLNGLAGTGTDRDEGLLLLERATLENVGGYIGGQTAAGDQNKCLGHGV